MKTLKLLSANPGRYVDAEELPATAAVDLAAGDRFVIETPGGGYGARRSMA